MQTGMEVKEAEMIKKVSNTSPKKWSMPSKSAEEALKIVEDA